MNRTMECGGGRVRICKLTDRATMIRVEDNATRFFEGLWEIPEGITYNSYIVFGDNGIALLDTVKRDFQDCFLEALSGLLDVKSLDYIVVHHSEPDHSGALPLILKEASRAMVLSHPIARSIIESRYGLTLTRYQPLRDGLTLDLGNARLRFVATPWLHWPDTFMSLLEGDGVLFSGDAFGAYSIPQTCTDEEVDFNSYERSLRKYFATVIGGYRDWVVRNLPKVRSLNFKLVAPLHGLVLRKHVWDVIRLYDSWGRRQVDPDRALAVYVTMYGSSEDACRRVASMLDAKGVEVRLHGFNDRGRSAFADVVADALDSGLLVLCAPTYEASANPLSLYLVDLLCSKAAAGQEVLLVSSYGWGGAAANVLKGRLEACGMRVKAVVEVKGRPSEEELRRGVELLLA